MPTIANLNVAVTATGGLGPGLAQAANEVDNFNAKVNASGGGAGVLGGIGGRAEAAAASIKGMKEQFEQLMPAIGAAAAAVYTLDSIAKGADDASNAFLRGEQTAQEMGISILESIPGVKFAAEFEQGMVDAFWNTSAAIAKMTGASDEYVRSLRTANSLAEELQLINEQAAQFNAANKQAAEFTRTLEDQIALTQARTDEERELLRIDLERRDNLARIEQQDERVTEARRAYQRDQVEQLAQEQRAALERQKAEEAAKEAAAEEKRLADEAAREEAKRAAEAQREAEKLAKAADDERKARERADEAEAKRLIEATRTREEKFEEELWRIDELRRQGRISDETARRAVDKAAKDGGFGGRGEVLAGVAERGSAEAFAASRRTYEQSQKVEQDQLATLHAIAAVSERQVKVLEDAFGGSGGREEI